MPQYYRGEFNPNQQSEIISMYNPQELNQFVGAAQQHQQRFDQGTAAAVAEQARIGELETYDLKDLTSRLKSFEGNINELVQNKYNGDYGAAANEIAKMIGTERTNPFYHFNKQKVEAGKTFLEDKRKLGANFVETTSPFDVSFDAWQKGQTFNYTPINRNDIVQNSAITFGTLAKTLMATPDVQLAADERLLKITIQKGLKDPQAVMDFIQNNPVGQKMYQQVLNSMPELQGAKDPTKVHDAVIQGAYAAIGGTDVNFTGNPGYMDPMEKAKLAGLGAPREELSQVGFTEAPSSASEILNSKAWGDIKDPMAVEEAKRLGIPDIKTYEDLVKYSNKGSFGKKALGVAAGYTAGVFMPPLQPNAMALGMKYANNQGKGAQALKAIEDKISKQYATNKDMFSYPLYNLDPLIANSSEESTYLKHMSDNLNQYADNMQPNDFAGMSEKDDRLLEDLREKKVKGIFFVPTGNENIPLNLGFHITGTKGSGAKKEEVDVRAMVNYSSGYDINNLIKFLATRDRKVANTVLKQVEQQMLKQPGGREKFDQLLKERGISREELKNKVQ